METPNKLKDQFLVLYGLALADNQVDSRELKFLHDWGMARGISQEDMDHLLLSPDQPALPKLETLPEKIEYLYIAATMLHIDGTVDKREQVLFRSMCRYMGFLDENIPELMDFMFEKVRSGATLEGVQEIVKNNSES